MLASLLALFVMQVGPNPATGAIPDVPEELRNRPPRDTASEPAATASVRSDYLARCLALTNEDSEAALDFANVWRGQVEDDLELAQSAHCLGLGLVRLERYGEAREAFEVASSEAPDSLPAYRARLAAMAGNAALADGKPATAEPLFSQAIVQAAAAGDTSLSASLHIDRARALVAAARPEEAVAALATARDLAPDDARAWLLSATLSRRLERLGEAQQQIERAAELDPRSAPIGLEAGVIAALSGRDADARRSFESVLIVAPDSDEANRARAYLEQLAE